MKKYIFCIILFCVIGGVLSAQQLPRVTIVNNTGFPMNALYIQPSGDGWSNWWINYLDIGGNNLLTTNRSLEVVLPLPLSVADTYDLFFFDTDDDMYVKENVRIRANMRIEFVFDDIVWR